MSEKYRDLLALAGHASPDSKEKKEAIRSACLPLIKHLKEEPIEWAESDKDKGIDFLVKAYRLYASRPWWVIQHNPFQFRMKLENALVNFLRSMEVTGERLDYSVDDIKKMLNEVYEKSAVPAYHGETHEDVVNTFAEELKTYLKWVIT